MIWICIPVYNNIKYTVECLQSLQKQSHKDFKVVVCDDGSTDHTSEIIKNKFPDVVLLKGDGNLWWAGAINECLKYCLKNGSDNDYILLLNNDLVIKEDYLFNITENFQEGTVTGSITADIEHPDVVVYAGELINKFTSKPTQFHRKYFQLNNLEEWETDTLPGRGTIFQLKLLYDIGLMYNQKMPQYAADNEFSVRAKKAGYKLLIKRKAVVYSHVRNTGIGSVYKKNSVKDFLNSFTSVRSPNYYKSRFYFASEYTFKFWLPVFLSLQLLRIIGAFIKRNYLGVKL